MSAVTSSFSVSSAGDVTVSSESSDCNWDVTVGYFLLLSTTNVACRCEVPDANQQLYSRSVSTRWNVRESSEWIYLPLFTWIQR